LLSTDELHDSRRIPLNATERAKRKGQFPYYGANGLVDHIDSYIFDGEYVLLAEDGGNFDKPERGVAYEVSGKFWVNNHAHILRPRGDMPPRFLRYWLNALDWMPYVGGTTRAKLTQAGMAQITIPLPPLPEQRRIIAKLDSMTGRTARARDELERIPRLIQKYREAILAAAFSGELTREWRHVNGYKAPPMSSLGALVSDIRYGTSKKCHAGGNGIAVLRIPNVLAGKIDLSDLKYAVLEPKELNKLRLQDGDVLIVRSNGSPDLVGRPALVENSAVGLAFAGYLIRLLRLRPKPNAVQPRFLSAMLQSPQIRKVIDITARSTSGVHNINSTELAALAIPCPQLIEQQEIVRRIESAFTWLDRVATEHANASRLLPKLDQAILAKAFRGELVLSDGQPRPLPDAEL
jgi:type I restriction enzyme S subunit